MLFSMVISIQFPECRKISFSFKAKKYFICSHVCTSALIPYNGDLINTSVQICFVLTFISLGIYLRVVNELCDNCNCSILRNLHLDFHRLCLTYSYRLCMGMDSLLLTLVHMGLFFQC